MTTPDATNDDLAEFLGNMRRRDPYRGSSDAEIVAREQNKLGYFLAAYAMAACLAAYAAGLLRAGEFGFSMGTAAVMVGGIWLTRRYRRLDDFAALLISRGPG